MSALRASCLAGLWCGVAAAAALVPLPALKAALPIYGLESNGGQAKPEILFLSRGSSGLAVSAQSIFYSPLGVQLNLVASNSNPQLRLADPLPGVVNSFTGADARKWVTGVSRYSTATLTEVYPGIDAQYILSANGHLTLRLLLRAGVDLSPVLFEIPQATSIEFNVVGNLVAKLGPSRVDPQLAFSPPTAFQEGASGRISRTVSFVRQSSTRFSLQSDSPDRTLPLQVEILLPESPGAAPFREGPNPVVDAAGNTFLVTTVPDAAGKDAPFTSAGTGCGAFLSTPIACTDVAVHKFSSTGQLMFVTYLAGRTREDPSFLRLAPDGALVLAGSTDSSDFPSTATALQPAYAGPPAIRSDSGQPAAGDFFAARLDAATGVLSAATFLGGPNADAAGETAMGADGSLYFMPKWIGTFSAGMPVTAGSLLTRCLGFPCLNGYAAHLSPALDRLLYGTYLPGVVGATARLHSDGTIYYAGRSGEGFVPTPTAYQRQPAGGDDGIVARLDAGGTKLLFATYLGGPDTDWILRMAVSPDGSVWVAESSFVQCCVNSRNRLVRLDPQGERILADKPIDVGDLAVDPQGNLFATVAAPITASPDAFLANACAGVAYLKLTPNGDQTFATYLPGGAEYDFHGTSNRGLPVLWIAGELFEVVEGQSMGVYTGCVVDAASFGNADRLSPGAIVTLFGSSIGPREGVAFDLVNGRVPVSLGGTQVLVDGQPVPILYASYSQVNVILPYSLLVHTKPRIQVVTNGSPGNEISHSLVEQAGVSIFRADESANHPAAALNEDGTVNSPRNPARRGSRVMLFGTGGGATIPPIVAGEIAPLALRPFESGVQVQVAGGPLATVEYAGAAPGLAAGVAQINIKLPDAIPDVPGFPRGTVPLSVFSAGSFYAGYVTVSVSSN